MGVRSVAPTVTWDGVMHEAKDPDGSTHGWWLRSSTSRQSMTLNRKESGHYLVAALTGGLAAIGARILDSGPIDPESTRRLEAVQGLEGVAILQARGQDLQVFASGYAAVIIKTRSSVFVWRDGLFLVPRGPKSIVRLMLITGPPALFLDDKAMHALVEIPDGEHALGAIRELGNEHGAVATSPADSPWSAPVVDATLIEEGPDEVFEDELRDTEPRSRAYWDLHAPGVEDTEPFHTDRIKQEVPDLWETEPNLIPENVALPPTPAPAPSSSPPVARSGIRLTIGAVASAFTALGLFYLLV